MKKIFTLLSSLAITGFAFAQTALVNKGQLVNYPGGGAGGANASATEIGIGMTLYGAGAQNASNNWVAEKIVVPASGWAIDSLITFAYQTGSSTVTTISGVFSFISADSSNYPSYTPLIGSRTVSNLANSKWSGIYRTPDETTNITNTQRPIMKNRSTLSGSLSAGTYWVMWNSAGSLTSGPWCPPVTILGTTTTGNALQLIGATPSWTTVVSGGNNQGVPFILYGKALSVGVNEAGITSNNIAISPSPMATSAQVTIQLAENAGITLNELSFVMFDISGKEVMKNENINRANFTIERGDLSAGTYLYKVINKNNSTAIHTGKLVIQ